MASIKAHILPPVVAAECNIVELTIKALILGVLLSMVLAAAGVALPYMTGLGFAPILGLAGLAAVIVYQYRTPFKAGTD